jgi:cytochrome c oxidase subunit 4
MDSTVHHDSGNAQHATPATYGKTYAFLMTMMFLTVAISRFQLGVFNNFFAMGIALAKATAVVLFFMQVKYSTKLTWVWAGLGFVWLFLLFGILGDYMTRAVLAAAGWTK